MLLTCVCLLCCFAVYFVWRRRTVFIDEPPMFPGALPFIGHLHLVFGDTTQFMKFIQSVAMESIKRDEVLKCILGPFTCYGITDPTDCLTAVNACTEKSGLYKLAKKALGDGLLTSNGKTWKNHRKLLNPMFTQQALNSFISVFNEQSRRLVNKFDDKLGNEAFEYEQQLYIWSLETACKTVMGVDVNDKKKENESYVRSINCLLHLFIRRGEKPWLYNEYVYSWTNLWKEEEELINIINKRSMQVLLERKRILNKSSEHGDTNDNFSPFIDHILELSTQKEVLTNEEVLDEVKTLIVTAYDTSATSLYFILMMLGAYKDVQNRAYEELNKIFEDSDRDVDKHDLLQMVYMEAIIKETLRLYPIAPVFAKHITTDIKLSKYTLRAGCDIAVLAFGLCRHPVWGADADQFRPERWLDPASLPNNLSAFPVFGLGRRACMGRNYAMMNLKTTLAHILRRYKITSYNNNPTLKMEVVMKSATPLLISLESRK